MASFLVRGKRVVLPDGTRAASIRVADGLITSIHAYDAAADGAPVIDAGDFVVLPGLVDTHVHINEPGRSEWEGFSHATRAAAAGGVTTLIDMPLNSIPPTTTVAGLDAKRQAADGCCYVDVGFWGGVVPGNTDQLAPLVEAGVFGFKCFLSPSGVEEFEHVSGHDLRHVMPHIGHLHVPLLAHAEQPALLDAIDPAHDPRAYQTWLDSRPPEAEHAAIDLLVGLAADAGAHVHIVHLASAGALPLLARAREAGVAVSVETCPHYLCFEAETIADGATAFKCAPPIRERKHREGLWQGLQDGIIDLIATDHSPAPPTLKHLADGDFVQAWGGIASLQLGLAAVWTHALGRNIDFGSMARWMSAGPAKLAGLADRKGAIAVGRDGDFVIWDPDGEVRVDASSLYHRQAVTPYDGARFRGVVRTTILRGQVIFDNGACGGDPRGQLLSRRDPNR